MRVLTFAGLVSADGEVEMASCIEQFDPYNGSIRTTETMTALEQCLMDADGEVEAEACITSHSEEPRQAEMPALTALEECLLASDGEVEAEACVFLHSNLESSNNVLSIDMSELQLETCLLNADGEVEMAACMERFDP